MPQLLIADRKGVIRAHRTLRAVGMSGDFYSDLDPDNLVRLPAGSDLFMLPDRRPIGCDPCSGKPVIAGDSFAVAAFLSPGYTATHCCAYAEEGAPSPLPLFSYAAACLARGELCAAAVRVDRDRRHDSRLIDMALVRRNARESRRLLPRNRLVPHLAKCALALGCPNARNFFLARSEAPLPVSPDCNASCAGCISRSSGRKFGGEQPRIAFAPSPEEVAEIALVHIRNVRDPIVSFGQGCEGEPLLREKTVADSIRLIRRATSKGAIHMNTNGSKPSALCRLIDDGLDSVRISLNSARSAFYSRYYRPRGYRFADVVESVRAAKRRGAFVSLNLLTMPGFTDSRGEFDALRKLTATCAPDMIQWRNLNYDPKAYFHLMGDSSGNSRPLGIRRSMEALRIEFPRLEMGYFNPYRRQQGAKSG